MLPCQLSVYLHICINYCIYLDTEYRFDIASSVAKKQSHTIILPFHFLPLEMIINSILNPPLFFWWKDCLISSPPSWGGEWSILIHLYQQYFSENRKLITKNFSIFLYFPSFLAFHYWYLLPVCIVIHLEHPKILLLILSQDV